MLPHKSLTKIQISLFYDPNMLPNLLYICSVLRFSHINIDKMTLVKYKYNSQHKVILCSVISNNRKQQNMHKM